jgi:DNA-binding PadR family transcriptional regulator
MGAGSAREHASTPMHSSVNWAVLGLVIERPSYAYELAHRFERTYAGALSLSSVSHIYTALSTLRERGLVHEVPDPRGAARSKRRYEATERGLCDHAEWLIAQIPEERRRQRVIVAQLGALARTPERATTVLDAYERACLAELAAAPPAGDKTPGTTGFVTRLVGEETRLAVAAKLRWVQYARTQLSTLSEPDVSAGPGREHAA